MKMQTFGERLRVGRAAMASAPAGGDCIGVHLLKQLSAYGGVMLEDSSIETVLVEQVSAAPEPLRSYIQALERQADPASNLRELVYAREERKMLGARDLRARAGDPPAPRHPGARPVRDR